MTKDITIIVVHDNEAIPLLLIKELEPSHVALVGLFEDDRLFFLEGVVAHGHLSLHHAVHMVASRHAHPHSVAITAGLGT